MCSAFSGLWGKQQKKAHVQRQSTSFGQTVPGNLESSWFGSTSVLFLYKPRFGQKRQNNSHVGAIGPQVKTKRSKNMEPET